VKRLTLIRHANAEWKNANIADFDRPLNKRGLSEAEAIGKLLLEQELVPELLLVSSARRTQQTAEILARVLGLHARRVKSSERLYLAHSEDLLALICETGPKVQHLGLVGHNPGITELAKRLAPAGSVNEMTTGSACTLTFTARSWAHLAPPATRALQLEPPVKLFSLFT